MSKKGKIAISLVLFLMGGFVFILVLSNLLSRQITQYKEISNFEITNLVNDLQDFDGIEKINVNFKRPSINIEIYAKRGELEQDEIERIFNEVKRVVNFQLVDEINREQIHWDTVPNVVLRFIDKDRTYKYFTGCFYTSFIHDNSTLNEPIAWEESEYVFW